VPTRIALILAAGSIAAACGGSSESSGNGSATELSVFAAGSLRDAFVEIGRAYQEGNPGVVVRFNFLGSSDLATQIEEGARADVFASADEPNMQRLIDQDLVESEPQTFAHNELAIVVPAGNPGDVRNVADLADDDLVVSLCGEDCPAGRYAWEILSKAGVQVEPDSLEPEVRAVVTRVQVGEADAGIVYATDVLAAGDGVTGIAIPAGQNVMATYPIAILTGSHEAAADFVAFVLSDRGARILDRHGFLPP